MDFSVSETDFYSDVSNAQNKHSTPFLSDVNVSGTDNHHSSTSISARSSVKTCISHKYKNDPEIPRPHFMLDTKVSLAREQEAKKNRELMAKSSSLSQPSKFKVIPLRNEVIAKEDCVLRGAPLFAEQTNQFAAQLRKYDSPTGKTPKKECTLPITPQFLKRTKK
ncbi:hypothetical protein DdX_03919 [Ditylenchus destructor]|uniref:Uncharacterized protein n=1 Tax=Ditylenchus destructor TaxID=166010 RepID=A0AAD4NB87_9BILA|nr:hypothetical protein DdX_03919 [Ditylenchus destructor]